MTGIGLTLQRRETLRNFLTFLATSGASACVNIGLRALLSIALFYELAVALAYLCSTTIAFALARRFVFTSRGGDWRGEYARFWIVNLFGFVQVLIVSSGLARILFPAIGFDWRPQLIAHVTALASLAFTSYFAHLRFSFRAAAAGSAP